MNEKLYQEELMDHFTYPRNKKKVQQPSFSAGQDNPSCGDRVTIEGVIKNNSIVALGFSGNGCVISQATTSMLTEHCIGKTIEQALAITKDDLIKLVGITLGPNRLKCALLCLAVLQAGLIDYLHQKGK